MSEELEGIYSAVCPRCGISFTNFADEALRKQLEEVNDTLRISRNIASVMSDERNLFEAKLEVAKVAMATAALRIDNGLPDTARRMLANALIEIERIGAEK